MKRLVRVLAVLTLVVSCFGWVTTQQAMATNLSGLTLQSSSVLLAETELLNPADAKLAEFGKKIDLNNSNVRMFREFRGFYPTLASAIVNNAPYDEVEDVLEIPGLSETQKERLQEHLDDFIVTPVAKVYNEGGDRYNPGIY